jgi:hypothetical protein
MDERQDARLVEEDIDHHTLGWRDEHLIDVLLVLVVPAVGTDQDVLVVDVPCVILAERTRLSPETAAGAGVLRPPR